jgi:sugar lactone lactonase YvrE
MIPMPAWTALVVTLMALTSGFLPPGSVRLHQAYLLPAGQHPESVVYDSRHRTFYASGLARSGIMKVLADGRTVPFVDGASLPYNSTVGLRIDAARNVLWACNSDAFALFDAYNSGDPSRLPHGSALLSFDLDTGKPRRTIPFNLVAGVDPADPQLCNDIAIDREGDAYATDSVSGYVVRVDARSRAAAVLSKDPRLHPPFTPFPIGANGIQLTPDERWLYVNVMGPGLLLRMHPDGSDVQEVELNEPIHGDGFIITGNRTAYVVESTPVFTGPHRVEQIEFGGTESQPTATVTRTVPWPEDVAFDTPAAGSYGDGRFWIADAAFNHFGDREQAPGQFFGVELR